MIYGRRTLWFLKGAGLDAGLPGTGEEKVASLLRGRRQLIHA